MKWPVAHSPNLTWFWLELVGKCCERLKIIMECTNIQFCERLGHGWQFHPLTKDRNLKEFSRQKAHMEAYVHASSMLIFYMQHCIRVIIQYLFKIFAIFYCFRTPTLSNWWSLIRWAARWNCPVWYKHCDVQYTSWGSPALKEMTCTHNESVA